MYLHDDKKGKGAGVQQKYYTVSPGMSEFGRTITVIYIIQFVLKKFWIKIIHIKTYILFNVIFSFKRGSCSRSNHIRCLVLIKFSQNSLIANDGTQLKKLILLVSVWITSSYKFTVLYVHVHTCSGWIPHDVLNSTQKLRPPQKILTGFKARQ